jgi:hypothetical protein
VQALIGILEAYVRPFLNLLSSSTVYKSTRTQAGKAAPKISIKEEQKAGVVLIVPREID